MKINKFLYLFLVLHGYFLLNCSMTPVIVRSVYPVVEDNNSVFTNFSLTNKYTIIKDDIEITLKYLDKKDLYNLAKINKNPYVSDGVRPILTVFLLTVKNHRKDKIKIDKNLIVLLDGLGNQYPVLDYETYKEMYPATYEKSYDYSFLFGQSYIPCNQLSDDYYKRKEAKKTLFQGGYIYAGVTINGILSFQRLSELVKKFTIIIPDVEIYEKDKLIKKEDFKFIFVQEIKRIEGN